MWVLNVTFPLNVDTMIADTRKVEEIVGKPCDGVGSGFGGRDVDWSFDNSEEVTAARDRLKAAGYTETYVWRGNE